MTDLRLQEAWRAHRAGNLAEAARLYGEILKADPRNFDALYGLGFAHFQSARYGEAERLIDDATKLNPRSADAFFIRGCALQRLQRDAEALAAFDRAVALRSGFVEALVNRGALLITAQRRSEGLASFDAALAANPKMAEAWNNRGNVLSELGRYDEAIASYDEVVALRPGMAEPLINRGTALLAVRRREEAVKSYNDAIRIAPQNTDALTGRANALFELKRYADAAQAYDAVLSRDPEYRYVSGNLAFCKLHCCDWRSLREQRAEITTGVRAGTRAINPFQYLALSDSPEDQLRCAKRWIADKYPPTAAPLWRGEIYNHDKIRLAYLSADFSDHAVGTALVGVFEHHDKTKFETIALSFAKDETSRIRPRLVRAFDRFIDVERNTDAQIAALIRQMEVDIAVDLMGFTGECRPSIFALKAAPIQVNFLGYPGTLGAEYFDTIIADRIVIAENEARHYAERVVYLPDSYIPTDSLRRVAERQPTRVEAGLPELGFVYCSFNNSYKFSPELFDVWMRLLKAVEGSVLWLPQSNPTAMGNLRREAEARDVRASRLIFAPFVDSPEQHLARLGLADLFLDTLPYNGHTTTCDALWAGVPVVTTPGRGFASRVAASALHAAGLPELVADSLEAYEATALKLARDPAALAAIKRKLKANLKTCALFDTARYTRNLEAAYLSMCDGRHT